MMLGATRPVLVPLRYQCRLAECASLPRDSVRGVRHSAEVVGQVIVLEEYAGFNLTSKAYAC